jgi:ComF family protein
MSLARFVGEALQLVWPARCAGCDAIVPDPATFCDACAAGLSPLVGACGGCALPQGAPVAGDHRCRTCRRVPFPFASGQAVSEYGEAIARAIVRMKHGGRRELGKRLARLLAPGLADLAARVGLEPGDVVVPVPLHPTKLRARGFNQSSEMARAALRILRRSGRPAPRYERALLLRTRPTRELGHAGPAARLAEVAGAFAVRDTSHVRGRRVIVIDDVFTTGATFSECAGALRAAGARAVHVLALARAV